MPAVTYDEVRLVADLPISLTAKGLLMTLWAERDVADLDGKDVANTFVRRLMEEDAQSRQRGQETMAAYVELHEAGYLIDTPDPRWGNSVVITLTPQQ